MDEQKVKALLERYFDGATSLAEEQELRRLLTEGDAPASLKPYASLFAFYATERAVSYPAAARAGRAIGVRWWIPAALAAGVALLITVKALTPTHSAYTYYVNGRRVYDKEAATAQAAAKLQMLAASMQHAKAGMASLEKLNEVGRYLEPLDKVRQTLLQVDHVISLAPTAEQSIH
ncbi:MAG: hypothetical protein LBH84_09495 [Prevotellaceae bacterium]|jgi:hypothetical protein|nr:hypothetical protein [Prevotellaceae bacterium]